MYRFFLFSLFLLGLQGASYAQTSDTLVRRKPSFVPLPAISSSPETGVTFGAFLSYYFDPVPVTESTPRSSIKLIAVYTTTNAIIFEPSLELFTKDKKHIIRVASFYNRYPDRHYGYGNDANERVVEYTLDKGLISEIDTVNYWRFNSDRLHLTAQALRRIRPNLYAGVRFQYENVSRYRSLADSARIITPKGTSNIYFEDEPNPNLRGGAPHAFLGRRSGIGVQATFDDRTNTDNPLHGSFIQFSTLWNAPWLGSDFDYLNLELDARHYINTVHDQTLALRVRSQHNFNLDDTKEVPIRALGRLGGRDYVRGYFFGTYQAKNMLAAEAEYRVPLFHQQDAPLWKVWRRMGITGFVGAGQAYDTLEEVRFSDFRVAGGLGLRYCLDMKQRVNIRIDYGWGFSPTAAYDGIQSGLYFFLSEAF